MFSRKHATPATKKGGQEANHLLAAKRTLRARGWSYRRAAPQLGVCYQHLALVLTGRRESQRLLARIKAIPHRTQV